MNFRNIFAVFSPRTAPSLITITCKAGLGYTLTQVAAFFKMFSTPVDLDAETRYYTQQTSNVYFLQPYTFSGFLEKAGQLLLVDAAVDASKILVMIAYKKHNELKKKSKQEKAQAKLVEIKELLKQKASGNRKSARKETNHREDTKSELETSLVRMSHHNSDDRPEQDDIEAQDAMARYSFYATIALENFAHFYFLVSLLEPVENAFKQILFSPSQFSLDMEQAILENQKTKFLPTKINFFAKCLNYLFTPKVAVVVLLLQFALSNIDFNKRNKQSRTRGNTPIAGLLNGLGFKFYGTTACYKLSRSQITANDFALSMDDLLLNDPEVVRQTTGALYFEKYAEIIALTKDPKLAEEAAIKWRDGYVDKVKKEVVNLVKEKGFLLDLAEYVSFYGSYKLYKNLLHVIDNLLDIQEQGRSRPSEDTWEPLRQRLSRVERYSRRHARDSEVPELPLPKNLKAVSYQAQGVKFPEEQVRNLPKVKTRTNDEAFAAGDNKERVESKLTGSTDEKEKADRRAAILSRYAYCNKELLRTILECNKKEVNKTISESEILKLADDLNLEYRKTAHGYMIQVYKQMGASFHNSHGKDRAGTVNSAFVSEFSQAFHKIDINPQTLDERDDELAVMSCCRRQDIFDMIGYSLTERPRTAAR